MNTQHDNSNNGKKTYQEVITDLQAKFASGDLPDAVALTYMKFPDVPCSKYTLLNRILIMSAGTHDARGYKQWLNVGRQVQKGKKAFYIFVPILRKENDKDGELKTVCKGFRTVPMFRFEDTKGDEIPEHAKPTVLPPLVDVAEKAGIKVSWSKTSNGEYGSFIPSTNEITLSSEDANVFFHELVHAYDNKTTKLIVGQDPIQECVAEFGACVLAQMFGIPVGKNSYDYIKGYSGDKDVGTMCTKVLTRVDKIVKAIMADHESITEKPIAPMAV